jgi:hypothetical protein
MVYYCCHRHSNTSIFHTSWSWNIVFEKTASFFDSRELKMRPLCRLLNVRNQIPSVAVSDPRRTNTSSTLLNILKNHSTFMINI